jgi:VWFA-related protein
MRRVIMLGCCVVCVAAAVAAQQTPIFRAAVDMVQVDVSVLDKDRKPVRGLTAADFTVLEDGKPQKIATFSAVDVPDPPAPLPMGAVTWPREIAPDVQTNALPPEGRLWVMLLDDALLPPDAQIVEAAKRAAASVVNHLNPADQMAIVFTERSRAAQNFTSDHARLLAAVETLQAGRSLYKFGWDTAPNPSSVCPPPVSSDGIPPPCIYLHPQQDSDMAVRVASMRTLEDVADALVALPQRRKVLVYVSPGIPVNASAASAPNLQRDPPPPKSLLAPPPPVPPGATTQMPMMDREAMLTILSGMPALFRQMQRSNVTLYAIDPAGLDGLASYIQRNLANVPALSWIGQEPVDGNGQTPLGKVPIKTELAHFETNLALDFLETAATTTGGRAIVNTNDLEPGIDEMFRENSSYYLIGYQATDPGSGKLHRTDVKVNRDGVEVRHQSGYYASDARQQAKDAQAPPLARAISSAMADAELPLHVAVAPFRDANAKGATVAIVLGLNQPPPKARMTGAIDLRTSVFTADGIAQGTPQSTTAHMTLLPGAETDVVRLEMMSRVDLAPGRYQLRLAAHSEFAGKTGSVFADVEVPDFARAPVSLSGVLFEASSVPHVVSKDALATLVPIVPTALREFDRRDHVTAFVRAYQGGSGPLSPLTLSIRIVDEHNAVRVDRQDTLNTFTPTTRDADDRITLPLDQLAPGAYLLTIQAALGTTTTAREVRFTVK